MSAETSRRIEEENFQRPFRVGIIGAMASGKSTLADLLGERWGVQPIKERWQENPFLDDFYENPEEEGISFKTQLRFLILKAEQMRQASKTKNNISKLPQVEIFDPTIEMDAQYAWVHATIGLMNRDEYLTYRKVFTTLQEEIPPIDLFILADASSSVLSRRIFDRKRLIEHPEFFENYPSYLKLLSVAARDLCKNLAIEHPVFVVDGDVNNIAEDEEAGERIASQIENMTRDLYEHIFYINEDTSVPRGKDGRQLIVPDFLKAK